MAERISGWRRRRARLGRLGLPAIRVPRPTYLPTNLLRELSRMMVPTSRESKTANCATVHVYAGRAR